jgi:hypothetical protein
MGVPPALVNIGGQAHLVYELQLRNRLESKVTLRTIDVVWPATSRVVTQQSPHHVLRPDERRIFYFWIPLNDVPDTIEHRILLTTATDTLLQVLARAPIDAPAAPALGAPLRGGPWVAVYDPALERGHRRVLFENDAGGPHIPARYAIDWMRINDRGELTGGHGDVVSNYFGYGNEVLAVADGVVVSVRDGVLERKRRIPIAHGARLASGNFVTIDVGAGRFVSYEHLQPGSITVQPGEVVRRGQVIARVGFSGDGSHPHLHMHVSDGATPMTGEGQPWVLAEYELIGSYPNIGAVFAARPWLAADAEGRRRRELPAPNAVVLFAP